MQFYPADWIKDTVVLTQQAKGCWIDILCQLWISETPGEHTWNRFAFKTMLRLDSDQIQTFIIAELSRVSDLSMTDKDGNEVDSFEDCTWIKIASRRIQRDFEKLNMRKERNKRYYYRNKTFVRRDQDAIKTIRNQKSEIRNQKSEVISGEEAPPKSAARKDLRPDSDAKPNDEAAASARQKLHTLAHARAARPVDKTAQEIEERRRLLKEQAAQLRDKK